MLRRLFGRGHRFAAIRVQATFAISTGKTRAVRDRQPGSMSMASC
jgi:hypothetical protein